MSEERMSVACGSTSTPAAAAAGTNAAGDGSVCLVCDARVRTVPVSPLEQPLHSSPTSTAHPLSPSLAPLVQDAIHAPLPQCEAGSVLVVCRRCLRLLEELEGLHQRCATIKHSLLTSYNAAQLRRLNPARDNDTTTAITSPSPLYCVKEEGSPTTTTATNPSALHFLKEEVSEDESMLCLKEEVLEDESVFCLKEEVSEDETVFCLKEEELQPEDQGTQDDPEFDPVLEETWVRRGRGQRRARKAVRGEEKIKRTRTSCLTQLQAVADSTHTSATGQKVAPASPALQAVADSTHTSAAGQEVAPASPDLQTVFDSTHISAAGQEVAPTSPNQDLAASSRSSNFVTDSIPTPVEEDTVGKLNLPILEQDVKLPLVTYEVINKSSQRNRSKLCDSRGYSYTVMRKRDNRVDWRCSIRNKITCCKATVKQTGSVFVEGPHPHCHQPAIGVTTAAKVVADVCQNAASHFLSAACIDEEVLLQQLDEASCLALPKPANLARQANYRRQRTQPKEPTDLDFEIDLDHIPDDFLQKDV